MFEEKHEEKELLNARRLTRFGILGTAVYVILIFTALPSLATLGWIKIAALELNQVGDFLAGLFGPLAIFWIVLGFFQQGQELRNSVNTLKLQAKELALSVEQQRELVSVTRDTLEHERKQAELSLMSEIQAKKPRPVITMKVTMQSGDTFYCSLQITNAGHGVSNVKIIVKVEGKVIKNFESPYWDRGNRLEDGHWNLGEKGRLRKVIEVSINYLSSSENSYELLYRLRPPPFGNLSELYYVDTVSETIFG